MDAASTATASEVSLSPTPAPATAFFDFSRPAKKRNYIRRRDDSEDEASGGGASSSVAAPTPASAPTTAEAPTLQSAIPAILSSNRALESNGQATSTSPPPDDDDNSGLSLAEILRRRKKQVRPKKGLDIAEIVPKVSRDTETETLQPEEDDAAKDTAEQELAAVVNRFTHQTGQILDVDKHMVAYIETEMEKRRLASAGLLDANNSNLTFTSTSSNYPITSIDTTKSAFWQPTRPADRGATLGKLHEVDLGEENKLRNITRTQEATRRLEGGEPMEDVQMDGANGKKGYRRRRRNSQDIQRDKLVEEVLKESKLELYDEPDDNEEDDEGAADDRIAEKFRREFLDALMSRRRRGRKYQSHKKKDDAKKPRGPKLGGSRSARAAMRESQMAQSGGGKK
ncbi:hepatocellular carcinoma-associated antigen 59-domain-containing protein [Kalaharituber pfeilii]|nr:hepatocellular carcinoma-associated antigen 59-domain-containing protein [Kalaharituber pfeilii]